MQKISLSILAISLLFIISACGAESVPVQQQQADTFGQTDAIVTTLHNSQNSLDWGGTYHGVIMGNDSRLLNAKLTIDYDGTFVLRYSYINDSNNVFTYSGNFSWNSAGSAITLDNTNIPRYYRVGENVLIQLDSYGNNVMGHFPGTFQLIKNME